MLSNLVCISLSQCHLFHFKVLLKHSLPPACFALGIEISFKFAQYLSDLDEPVNIVMEENIVYLWPSIIFDFVQACLIIMFAYSCQVNLPQIYAELSLDTQSTISIPWWSLDWNTKHSSDTRKRCKRW